MFFITTFKRIWKVTCEASLSKWNVGYFNVIREGMKWINLDTHSHCIRAHTTFGVMIYSLFMFSSVIASERVVHNFRFLDLWRLTQHFYSVHREEHYLWLQVHSDFLPAYFYLVEILFWTGILTNIRGFKKICFTKVEWSSLLQMIRFPKIWQKS